MTTALPDTTVLLTEEQSVGEPAATTFYELYSHVFGPLRSVAAARHLLDRDEWDQEMADERIVKIIAWDGPTPVGMATLALDLDALPWISADFYRSRYGDRPVYYCGINLVLPEHQGRSVFSMVTRRAFEIARRNGALGAWDCSTFTEEQTLLVEKLISVARGNYPFEPEVVDSQRYFVVDPSDSASGNIIDLRAQRSSGGSSAAS